MALAYLSEMSIQIIWPSTTLCTENIKFGNIRIIQNYCDYKRVFQLNKNRPSYCTRLLMAVLQYVFKHMFNEIHEIIFPYNKY